MNMQKINLKYEKKNRILILKKYRIRIYFSSFIGDIFQEHFLETDVIFKHIYIYFFAYK